MSNFTAILLALYALTGMSLADEVWVCRFPVSRDRTSLAHYWLFVDHFVKMEFPHEGFTVLTDTDLTIVAVNGVALGPEDVAPTPSHPNPTIGSETLAINRKTGDAVKGAVVLYDFSNKPFLHGTCRQQMPQDRDAVWPEGFNSNSRQAPDAKH
jgi:hypothetical protein